MVLDLGGQRFQRAGHQREVRCEYLTGPRQAAGAAIGGAHGLPRQRDLLGRHRGMLVRSAICSSEVRGCPRS